MQMHYMDEYICVHEPEISRFKIKLIPYVQLMSACVFTSGGRCSGSHMCLCMMGLICNKDITRAYRWLPW